MTTSKKLSGQSLTPEGEADTTKRLLAGYQADIEKKIQFSIAGLGDSTLLRDACEYALLNGGKRFRPTIVMMVAKALGKGCDVTGAALATEFFHTASLVADDLPCMDDDDERRDKPSVHKVHGEAVAMLVTYALIAAGYEQLTINAEALETEGAQACALAIQNVSHNTGINGATGGQYLDIFPPDLGEETLRQVLNKKTVSLFEISFVLGWLYGGGDISLIDRVKALAYHFGMAFQIADDFGDMEQDAANERAVNYASVLGLDHALEVFHKELAAYREVLHELCVDTSELEALSVLLQQRAYRYLPTV